MNWKIIFAVMSVAINCTSASSATDKGSLALVFEDKSNSDFFPQNKFIVGPSGVRYYYLENGRKKMYSEISIKDSKLIYTTCELRPKQNPKCEPGVEGGYTFPVNSKASGRFGFSGVLLNKEDKGRPSFEIEIKRCIIKEDQCESIRENPQILDKDIIVKFVPEGNRYRAMVIKRLETWETQKDARCSDIDSTKEVIFDISKDVPSPQGKNRNMKWEKHGKTMVIPSADFPAGLNELTHPLRLPTTTEAGSAIVKKRCSDTGQHPDDLIPAALPAAQ